MCCLGSRRQGSPRLGAKSFPASARKLRLLVCFAAVTHVFGVTVAVPVGVGVAAAADCSWRWHCFCVVCVYVTDHRTPATIDEFFQLKSCGSCDMSFFRHTD